MTILTKYKEYLLRILAGFFWTITYILIIIVGFRDGVCGMPVIALFANLSWEYIFSFNKKHTYIQTCVNKTWLIFDFVIFYQFLIFGHKMLLRNYSSYVFYLFITILLLLIYLIIKKISETIDKKGLILTFVQTLIMSILFNIMYIKSTNQEGQTIYVAIFKMLGDLFASIDNYLRDKKILVLNYLYVSIFIFDLVYIFLFLL